MNFEKILNKLFKKFLLAAHPINSVYISYDNTDPNKLFGGYWERLDSVFLFAATERLGECGGESETTLTSKQLPKHEHCVYPEKTTTNCYFMTKDEELTYKTGGYSSLTILHGRAAYLNYQLPPQGAAMIATDDSTRVDNLRGEAHNNMPPYVKVAMWRRVG